jgi:glutamyl-tRNA synthetase
MFMPANCASGLQEPITKAQPTSILDATADREVISRLARHAQESSVSTVRTRFAPSPTGFLHLGGVRTMLFSWLLARHFGGTFIYRLEDTDRARLVPESVKGMVDDFAWLGLDIDEGPTAAELQQAGYAWEGAAGFRAGAAPCIQSLRLLRYREIAEQLIRDGVAYRCDCTPERLDAERQEQMARGEQAGYSGFCRERHVPADVTHVVRFRIADRSVVHFHDALRGTITWDPVILRDTVILKSDGFPTYHLAATVDDHDMAISHVLRGEEWISTTPLHVMLNEALGWKQPAIAHLPVMVGKDGKKLSKRHGATFCSTFREDGYLPQALLNYVLLNGWSPGGGEESEVMSRDEMIARFSLDAVQSSPAQFSYEKLAWMNGVYLRNTPDGELARVLEPFVAPVASPDQRDQLRRMIPYIRERLTGSLKDAIPLVDWLFADQVTFGPAQVNDLKISPEDAARMLTASRDALMPVDPFEPAAIESALHVIPDTTGLSKKAVFMGIRVAVTGRKATPPLFECISVLGKTRTLERLQDGVAALSS